MAVQAIALPVIMYMMHTGYFKKRKQENPWFDILTEAERRAVLDYYTLHESVHRVVLQFVAHRDQIPGMASYMAAAFAFSTKVVPRMYSMEQVIKEFYASDFGEDTRDWSFMKSDGLLIVSTPFASFRGIKGISGNIAALFEKRLQDGRPTVFLQAPTGPVQAVLDRGKMPTREVVSSSIKESDIGGGAVGDLLMSWSTYVQVLGAKPLGVVNECRASVYI